MKRFKKLAAGMVAAGMALAMLPVAAAQADDYFFAGLVGDPVAGNPVEISNVAVTNVSDTTAEVTFDYTLNRKKLWHYSEKTNAYGDHTVVHADKSSIDKICFVVDVQQVLNVTLGKKLPGGAYASFPGEFANDLCAQSVSDETITPEESERIYGIHTGAAIGEQGQGTVDYYNFYRASSLDANEIQDKGRVNIRLQGLRPNTFYGNRNIPKVDDTYTPCEWDEKGVYTTCDSFYRGYGNIATAPNGLYYTAFNNMRAHAKLDEDWNVLNAGQKFAVNTDVLYVGAQVVYKAKEFRSITEAKQQIAPLSYNAVHIPNFTTKPKGSGSTVAFTDVHSGTPHVDDIRWLAENKISEGYKNANGTYRFEGMTSVYRQDMAAFLRREAVKRGISDAASWKPSAADRKRFRDVTCTADNKGNRNTPHCEDILWLAHANISEGWKEKDGSSTFRGMDTVKRQDMAAFLKRLAAKAGKGGNVKPKTDFTDVTDKTPHWREVQWLGGSGISEGYKNPNGSWRFEGMTSVYRQDMAAFIHRLDNLIAK